MMANLVLLHDFLLTGREHDDRRVAITRGEQSFTYGEFKQRVEHMANRLVATGAQRGDRVAIFLPKSFEECVAIFAASRADLVFVPVNPSLRQAQVRHIVEDCSASVLITSADMLGLLGDALEGLSCLRAVVHFDTAAGAPPAAPARSIGEDLAAILYTSGSTGRPKGVMISHRNLLAGTRIVRSYLNIGPDERILSVLPFSFDYGLNQLLTVVEQGAELVLFDFKMGDEIVHALSRHEITGLAGVPTIWAMLTRAAPSLARTPLPHLRYITNSGGAVPTSTVKQLRTLLPDTKIYLMYGLTEAFRSTYLPPEEVDHRPNSIGKAIPECEVFPVTEDGRRAGARRAGHSGPSRTDRLSRVLEPPGGHCPCLEAQPPALRRPWGRNRLLVG